MGSVPPSPQALSPPLGSMQKPPTPCGKNGALAASAIFPPPPAHAAGFGLDGGGGGGPRRGSSSRVHAATRRRTAARAAAEIGRKSGMGGGRALPSTFFHSVAIVSAWP